MEGDQDRRDQSLYTADRNEATEWRVPYGEIEAVITRDDVFGMFQVHLSRGPNPEEFEGSRWTTLDRCMKDIQSVAIKRGKVKKDIAA